MLLGVLITFSITGYAKTKPAKTHPITKTASKATSHAKSFGKENTANKGKSILNNKNSLATVKAAHKQNTATTAKPALQKKSFAAKDLTSASGKKKTIASTKHILKKQLLATAIQKTHKQKPPHKIRSAAFDPNDRKHTVISSKSIESTPIHSLKLQNPNLAILDMDNAESSQNLDNNSDNPFRPVLIDSPQPTKINTAHVAIETSLFLDGLEADLSKELILQLTEIFAWDIDFATNLRPGDQFSIVYGKKMVDGKETDSDEIIAAEFINQGVPHTAVRYVSESGISYYTPDGQSMQRAFLTTPVDFIKISSPFDTHRKHPILNRIRSHKGIDYAARTGTPVKTTGDGIVTFCGRNGAYGQVIIVQHNDRYETLYAHLSDFKKGLTAGDHVKQSDIIGYVGQTGLATGPHLHYEFHVDGIYRDPETVKIPHSMPISAALLADFKIQTQPYYVQLTQVKAQSLLAKNHSAGTPLPPASMQSPRYN